MHQTREKSLKHQPFQYQLRGISKCIMIHSQLVKLKCFQLKLKRWCWSFFLVVWISSQSFIMNILQQINSFQYQSHIVLTAILSNVVLTAPQPHWRRSTISINPRSTSCKLNVQRTVWNKTVFHLISLFFNGFLYQLGYLGCYILYFDCLRNRSVPKSVEPLSRVSNRVCRSE